MDILEYCDTVGLKLKITYHPNQDTGARYICEFEFHIAKKNNLSATTRSHAVGFGDTINQAMNNIARNISGKILIVEARKLYSERDTKLVKTGEEEKIFKVPRLSYIGY